MMPARLSTLTKDLTLNIAAPAEALTDIEHHFGTFLPEEYKSFMCVSNGAWGPIGRAGYVHIWRAEDVIAENEGRNISQYAPGLIAFATNGGSELYAFDAQNKMRVVKIPSCNLSRADALACGDTFSAFLEEAASFV